VKITLPPGCPTDPNAAFEALFQKESLSIDDIKALTLLEASGKALYGHLADCSGNPEIRSLLNKNGQEEVGHAHRLLKVLHILTGQDYEIPSDTENPFIGPSPFTELTPELLENFIQGELDGEGYYNRWADHAGNDQVAGLYRQIGMDERRHSERDRQVLKLLMS
jgi:rubrerythrin